MRGSPERDISSLDAMGLGPGGWEQIFVFLHFPHAHYNTGENHYSHCAVINQEIMEKKIMDQLEESNASKHLRSTAFEMALFGTGVIKGPFAVNKEYPDWSETGDYIPKIKVIPQLNHVSVWNFYPDPDANNMDEAQYVVERDRKSVV